MDIENGSTADLWISKKDDDDEKDLFTLFPKRKSDALWTLTKNKAALHITIMKDDDNYCCDCEFLITITP
jgi:hypothetical protein